MAKPIVVIYIPENFVIAGRRNAANELMDALNGGFGRKEDEGKIEYSDYWKEYYWLCFYKSDIDAPEFKVFYEKDFTEIQYGELRKVIDDAIKQQNVHSTT